MSTLRYIGQRGGFVKWHSWPLRPFATAQICFVEATKGWHYCVLDFDGGVRDPWKEERRSLDHPDYKRVLSVIGLFKISRKLSEAIAPHTESGR